MNLTSGIYTGGDCTTFRYGASKQRVTKEDEEGVNTYKTYYFHGSHANPAVEIRDTPTGIGQTKYVYGPTGLIAFKKDNNWFFLFKDHLGSTRGIMNNANTNVSIFSYMPFGGLIAQGGFTYISEDLGYRFTGQALSTTMECRWKYDTETGLHNFKARMYDDLAGRFYAVDPAGQFASPYTGIGNNPVNFTDPSGEAVPLIAVGMIVAAVWTTGVHVANTVSRQGSGAKWDWEEYGTDLAVGVGSAALGSMIPGVNGIIPGALVGGGTSVVLNGFSNTIRGNDFFNGWESSAVTGGIGGAISGFQKAKVNLRDPILGTKLNLEGGQVVKGTAAEIAASLEAAELKDRNPDVLALYDPEVGSIPSLSVEFRKALRIINKKASLTRLEKARPPLAQVLNKAASLTRPDRIEFERFQAETLES